MKQHWERHQAYLSLTKSDAQKLIMPVTTDMITSLTLLESGCINTHYRIDFEHERSLVLRFYQEMRKQRHESRLYTRGYKVNCQCQNACITAIRDHCYSIMTWAEGQVMRDVLLNADTTTQRHCTALAGQVLLLCIPSLLSSKAFLMTISLSHRCFLNTTA